MKNILVIALIVLAIVFSCLPLFKNINNINSHWDWLQILSYYRLDRQSLLEFHQFPLRTHYFGGGFPAVANPQDGSLNPFFIPVLLFGEVVGIKLNIFLAHLVAALGMYYLTRYILKYNYPGALFSTLVFCLGGYMHRLLIRGQEYIISFYAFFIPLSVAFFIKAKDQKRYLFYTVFILTIIITQAGLYIAPTLLFIFLFSCFEAVKYKNKKFIFDFCYINNFFIIIFLVLLLAAVKILPVFELLKQNSRSVDSYNPFWGPLFPNIYKTFFVPQVYFPFVGLHWNYFYLGFTPVILAFAAFLIFWKKNARFFLLFIVFALLSFGAHTQLDLFKLLRFLPFFHSIEAPTRYFIPVVIFIIALSSGSFFLIQEKIKRRFINLIFILILLFTFLDLLHINGTREESFPVFISKYPKHEAFFPVRNFRPTVKISSLIPKSVFITRSWEWTLPSQYELVLRNIGKINWYGNIHLGEYAEPKYYIDWNEIESLEPKNYVWHKNSDYRGEVYFLNYSDNRATFQYFSPNKMVVSVEVVEPDTLVVNQNYDKYWKADFGKPVNYNGLLAVNLIREGNYFIRFTYKPLSFYLGLAVSLVTFLFLIFFFKKYK